MSQSASSSGSFSGMSLFTHRCEGVVSVDSLLFFSSSSISSSAFGHHLGKKACTPIASMYSKIFCVLLLLLNAQNAFSCPDIDGLTDRNCDRKLVVVGFGDSITYGIGDNKRLGYLGWLKTVHPNITIVNLGNPGEGTSAGKVRAARTIPYIPEADYTIILQGTNDFFETKKSYTGTRDNLAKIRQISLNSGGQTFLSSLTQTLRHNGQADWIAGVNRSIASFRNLDFYSLGKTIIGWDQLHPDSYGYQSMANYVSKTLLNTSLNNKPADSDYDGMYDFAEARYGTSSRNADSDGDGISDGAEVFTHGSNPLALDSDGDGFSDNYEVYTLHSDPASSAPGAPKIKQIQIIKEN